MKKNQRIATANIAGGSVRWHRTIEAAARRMADGWDEAYGGIVVYQASPEDQEAAEKMARELGR